MSERTLHDDSVIIDGLVISNWDRSVFEDMKTGGITAANCTCSVWEGFKDTMLNIAQWKRWFNEFDDIVLQVYTTEDIRRAKAQGKVGIILGWQNTWGIEDQLGFLHLFRDLGVKVMQLTYNTQNLVGSGCWETHDNGLSDYGRQVIEAMNELGIMVDLSHVGATTSSQTIAHSNQPVAYTHVAPNGLLDHPRNKTDQQLREIVSAVALWAPLFIRLFCLGKKRPTSTMGSRCSITWSTCAARTTWGLVPISLRAKAPIGSIGCAKTRATRVFSWGAKAPPHHTLRAGQA